MGSADYSTYLIRHRVSTFADHNKRPLHTVLEHSSALFHAIVSVMLQYMSLQIVPRGSTAHLSA